ncbi:hypothetical protein E2P81_ATG10488 [Venturia nashicola]|nr:hypothetical protein E2P81_ATG10488 [Venturia nashicola]
MGTLTANQPRLDTYCDHKLPTSCRLSSIGECCACYDERAHAAAYTTYVDGIGLVARGTRWQRYCWFCKEFWEARVAASGLRPGQTRIPEVPDQTPFLDRWYEFHRGYRVITKEDGSEERVAVLGEDLRDVEPGHLPRTLEELREGRERSFAEASEREVQRLQAAAQEEEAAGPTLEDTLDQLFIDASAEDTAPARSVEPVREAGPTQNVHAQAMVAAGSRNREYQARRIAALRRELHRMRNGIERVISGLREFGENVPDAGEATGQLTMLGRTLDDISGAPAGDQADLAIRSVNELTRNVAASQGDQTLAEMQTRVDEAREHVNEARRMRDQAASEFDIAEQEFNTSNRRLQQLQRDQRTAENYTRLFGSREEVAAQGDDYVSPIGGMFSRAYERFNVAEQVRQEERTLRQVLDDERRNGGEDGARQLEELESRPRDVWGVPRLPQDSTSNTTHLMEEARDEVFAGQTLAAMAEEAHQVAELQGDEPPGQNTAEDPILEDYYTLLRRQGWRQQGTEATPEGRPAPARELSDNTLEGIVVGLERENQTREQFLRNLANNYRAPDIPRTSSPVEPYSSTAIDRREDLVHVLHYIRTHDDWRERIGLDVNQVYMGLVICASSLNNAEIVEALLPRMSAVMGGMDPLTLLQRDDLVWRCGLPAARLARIRQAGQRVSFSNQPQTTDTEVMRGNMEVMAEAFQMSAELRRRSGLTAQEQLDMLARLQSGERREEDLTVLVSMLLEDDTVQLASTVHRQQPNPREDEQQTQLNAQRREAARDGDFSRQGLNVQRREASAFSIAAGRLAMQRGLTGQLFETSIARARHREQFGSWSSESEEEEDQEQGLDARDSGRPEPKTDEEMEVKLECRICYSQIADVACLPCGHLVMCRWCSDQHSPTMTHDRTRPRRAAGCPVCRKGIRQKVRVFRA